MIEKKSTTDFLSFVFHSITICDCCNDGAMKVVSLRL